MSRFSRRSFLAGSAALIAAPALAQTPDLQDVDVAIVGAGAAGIAAARRLLAAKRSVVGVRGLQPRRRALRHRQELLRRAVRSRRALDSQSGRQSAAGAGPAAGPRHLCRRRAGRACGSAGAARSTARWKTIWPAWCGRSARSTNWASSRPTCRPCACCRAISATGAGPSNSCSGLTRSARTSPTCRPSISRARCRAKAIHSAARAMARCWLRSPPACRSSFRRR